MFERVIWILRRLVGALFVIAAGAIVAGMSALMQAPILEQAALCLITMEAAFMGLKLT